MHGAHRWRLGFSGLPRHRRDHARFNRKEASSYSCGRAGAGRDSGSSDARTLLAGAWCFFSKENGRRQRCDDDRAERRVSKFSNGPIVVMVLGRRRGRGFGRLRRLAWPFAIHGEYDTLFVRQGLAESDATRRVVIILDEPGRSARAEGRRAVIANREIVISFRAIGWCRGRRVAELGQPFFTCKRPVCENLRANWSVWS